MTPIQQTGAEDAQDWFGQPHRLLLWSIAAVLMIVPIMLLGGVDDPGALVMLAAMLALLGGAYEVALRVPARLAGRAGLALGLAALGLLVWINLAVGIIKSEDDAENLIYALVVAVAGGGALLARFRPGGMARAMVAAAIAQVAAFIVAWAAGWQFTGPITVFFTALWLLSALLFARAARAGGDAG